MAAPSPISKLVEARLTRWNAQHPQHQIDLKAVNAVGQQEGYSGRIGDGGHAFGGFQLNDAGGVLTGKFPGWTPQQKQAWANSPAGIDYALAGIGKVAGGQTGSQAVRSIVSGFERPANIPGETARALAAYGQTPGGAGAALPSLTAPAATVQPPPPNPSPALFTTLAGANGDYSDFYQQLGRSNQAQTATSATPVVGALAPHGKTAPLPAVGGIAKTALTQLGTPYQWGGQAKLGSRTDCSGLLQASARANGINIGRTTYQQYQQGTPVPLDKLQPGDAVFSHPDSRGPGHVAIYIGNGKVVQDPHTGAVVSISQLDRAGIVGARRYQ